MIVSRRKSIDQTSAKFNEVTVTSELGLSLEGRKEGSVRRHKVPLRNSELKSNTVSRYDFRIRSIQTMRKLDRSPKLLY